MAFQEEKNGFEKKMCNTGAGGLAVREDSDFLKFCESKLIDAI